MSSRPIDAATTRVQTDRFIGSVFRVITKSNETTAIIGLLKPKRHTRVVA
jgi:hypothetical protein